MRLAIYALGGGLGHVTRGLGAARAAAARGWQVDLLVNAPLAARLLKQVEQLNWFAPHQLRTECIGADAEIEVARAAVWNWLGCVQQCCDAMLVDTFPRGLGGELADWLPTTSVPCFLVHRAVAAEYIQHCQLSDWIGHYQLIFLPGEHGAFSAESQARETSPWLICDHDQLLSYSDARRALGVPADANPLILVTGAGTPSEATELLRVAEQLASRRDNCHVRYSSLHPVPATSRVRCLQQWPLMTVLPAVDLLVGAGGYNTVRESRVSGVPLLAWPRQRRYDRQSQRLTRLEYCDSAETLLQRALDWSARAPLAPRADPPIFHSGAHAAMAMIAEALGHQAADVASNGVPRIARLPQP